MHSPIYGSFPLPVSARPMSLPARLLLFLVCVIVPFMCFVGAWMITDTLDKPDSVSTTAEGVPLYHYTVTAKRLP